MNIIVTGASRGIGYELVKIFSASSENRVIGISRDAARLNALREECIAAGPGSDVNVIPFDLAGSNDIEKDLGGQVKSLYDSLDILINNAGHLVRKPFSNLRREDFMDCLDVNYLAPVRLIQTFLPLLKNAEKAHVVNISSMGGVQGSRKFPGLSAYSASKAALQTLVECLAEEFGQEDIAFNTLALGSVQTEMLAKAFPDYRAPLKAVEMAEFIADFAIRGNRFFNGKTLPVSVATP